MFIAQVMIFHHQNDVGKNKKTARISVGDIEFKGSPGLYPFVFYKDPNYNKEDLQAV